MFGSENVTNGNVYLVCTKYPYKTFMFQGLGFFLVIKPKIMKVSSSEFSELAQRNINYACHVNWNHGQSLLSHNQNINIKLESGFGASIYNLLVIRLVIKGEKMLTFDIKNQSVCSFSNLAIL